MTPDAGFQDETFERTALVWLALGLALPALIDGWRGLLWGGIVRMAIHNHAMLAVNSICHTFGSQPFATGDESRNNRLIAVLGFGEGWLNNHHANGSPRLFWGLVKKPPEEIARIIRHSTEPPRRPDAPCSLCDGFGWEDPVADTLVKCRACGGRGRRKG